MNPGDLLVPRYPNDPTYHTTMGMILRITGDIDVPILQILWCDGVVTSTFAKSLLSSWMICKTPPHGV